MSKMMRLRNILPTTAMLSLTFSVAACTGDPGPEGPMGPAGPTGTNGTNGTNGVDGTNGTNGVSCSVTTTATEGVKLISCSDGTSATVSDGSNGEDGQSCHVTDNGNGTKTIRCEDGTSVTVSDGTPGQNGGNVEVTNFHGTDHLLSSGEYAAGKYFVKAQITGATADAAGLVTVNFTVKDEADQPVSGIRSIGANINKLVPAGGGEGNSKWVAYIYRTETVTAGDWPNPAGTTAIQAYRENNGTLTDNGDGSYRYVFSTNISNVTAGGTAITYERNLTHRVSIMMGGHSGPTADAVFDFVPDGSAVTATRNIVSTDVCRACHGVEFHGHGGDRLTVENCVTCHQPGSSDANGGETIDMKVMIHKIHAGAELASIPGADGIVWDNPNTPANEMADNGSYAIWGNRNSKHEWWKVEFPAVIENCQKCHQGTLAQVDNWKTKPSRAVCGSCHDTINFASGPSHAGGPLPNDDQCTLCHPAAGPITGISFPITTIHDWTDKDPRNVPEFDATLTVSTPRNGQFFVAGEAPVVTLQLKKNGAPIDHQTVEEDNAAEGCVLPGPCPAADGKFRNASLFVHGPRAKRVPVLTTVARARVLATAATTYDLSGANNSLGMVIDAGRSIVVLNSSGGDVTIPGTFSVPVVASAFANVAAATPAEIVAWLNANSTFKRRAIAYIDEATGLLAIRSRNLGTYFSVQLQAGTITSNVFGNDTTIHGVAGSTASNNISKRITAAQQDPKVTYTSTTIRYVLDPVDDLVPGTYSAGIEFADRGRIDGENYATPTVARVTFQVKTATEEKPPANNCDSCHQGPDGRGFILDFPRHNKKFDHNAVDMCGQCHDYLPQNPTGQWSGAGAIARRVHGVHFGSQLNYPLATVGYANGDPVAGRNWDINFPMDVRNCESCHATADSSGTWATKAARLPCMGCHDSDPAKAHIALMTYDPSPADPWSGDEQESCQTCH